MSWIDEVTVFTDCISRIGSSTYVCDEIYEIVNSNCRKEAYYTLFVESRLIFFTLNSYIDKHNYVLLHDFGYKLLSNLIVRCVVLSKKKNFGLRFIMEVMRVLDRKDVLYSKYRRVFLRMGLELSKEKEGSKMFYQFLMEILDELRIGLHDFLDKQGIWPDTTSLFMYISFLERSANTGNNDHVHKSCISILTQMETLLGGKLVKANSSMYFDLLLVLDRLTKLFGGEDHLWKLVSDRKDKIMALTISMLEIEDFTKVRTWLREQNLVTTFLLFFYPKVEVPIWTCSRR